MDGTPNPWRTLQLVPTRSNSQGEVIAKPVETVHSQLYGLILPIVAAGISIIVLLVVLVTMCFVKRRKAVVADIPGPSIVVYPSHQGATPQFLTKDILFSLPPLRHANSLGDLLGDENDSDLDTDSLVPVGRTNGQRSNSFSCYGLGVIDPAMYRTCSMDLEEELTFPEGHLGRLWFSVRYEPATEKLLVSLLKAKNLPSRTVGTINSCDPFVRLHLIPDKRRYLQSKLKKKTCNPFFDETFVFQVSGKDLLDHVLKLSVIDSGKTKRRGVIGHVSLFLKELAEEMDQKLFKMDLEKEPQESVNSDLGDLLISLVYNENLHRLSATVVEAKRLKFKEDRKDSYVRVTLSQNYRPVKVKRTSTVKARDDPNFSECFNFRLTPEGTDSTSLSFQVFQTMPGYGRDRLIGKFVLGSYMFARGKANAHWTSVFASPREAVQQWHSLST